MSKAGETLYDADSSVEARTAKRRATEKAEAKKGDVKTGKELGSDDPDAEFESVGTMRGRSDDPERISREDDDAQASELKENLGALSKGKKPSFNYELDEKGGKGEWYRKRQKPTS